MMLPAVAVMSSDHFLNWSLSSGGTPSMCGDHRHRKRISEVVHDVHAAAGQRGVHGAVHHILDDRGEPFHGGRREGLAHQEAEARVLGRVAVEHGVGAEGEQLLELLRRLSPG